MRPTKIENTKGDIVVASYGTTSTGVSMTGINNVIFASPYKSQVKVLQSIGRSLRLHEGKKTAYLYDIADNLSTKSYENHTFRHFKERIKIYVNDKFKFNIHTINL